MSKVEETEEGVRVRMVYTEAEEVRPTEQLSALCF